MSIRRAKAWARARVATFAHATRRTAAAARPVRTSSQENPGGTNRSARENTRADAWSMASDSRLPQIRANSTRASASAASTAMPSRSRPTTAKLRPLPGSSAVGIAKSIGNQSSSSTGNLKSFGRIPITSARCPSISSVRPTMAGSAPNRLRHSCSPRTVTRMLPEKSSPSRKARPSTGRAPSMSSVPAVRNAARRVSGTAFWAVRVTLRW